MKRLSTSHHITSEHQSIRPGVATYGSPYAPGPLLKRLARRLDGQVHVLGLGCRHLRDHLLWYEKREVSWHVVAGSHATTRHPPYRCAGQSSRTLFRSAPVRTAMRVCVCGRRELKDGGGSEWNNKKDDDDPSSRASSSIDQLAHLAIDQQLGHTGHVRRRDGVGGVRLPAKRPSESEDPPAAPTEEHDGRPACAPGLLWMWVH